MVRKEYKQRERRYVPEYCEKTYPERVAIFYNMAVGPAPEELNRLHPEVPLAAFRRWRFWIDAVVILQDRMILVEGKLRQVQGGLGQLLFYQWMLPQTPELAPYKHLAVEMVLVIPKPDPRILGFADRMGITVDVYRPEWAMEYLRELGMV